MPTFQEMLAAMGVPRGGGSGGLRPQVQDRWGRSPNDPNYGQPPPYAMPEGRDPNAPPVQGFDPGWGIEQPRGPGLPLDLPPEAGGPYGGWVPPTATNERPWTSIEEYQAAHPGLPDPGPGPFPMPWGQAPPPFGAPPVDPNTWWKLPYQQAQAAQGQVAGSAYAQPGTPAQQAALQQMGAVGGAFTGGAMPLGQFGRGGGFWGGLGSAFGRRR